jgi:hypothetical protein
MKFEKVASVRRFGRIAGGVGLVLHGLGHAVFPLRGADMLGNSAPARAILTGAWRVALVGFVAAGFGLLGVRPLGRIWRYLVGISIGASVVALGALPQPDLIPGGLIDAFAAVVLFNAITRGGEEMAPKAGPLSKVRWPTILRECAALGLLAYFATCAATRSWHRRWGAAGAEISAALPGDLPGRNPVFEINHAITIDAPPASVFPWLLQLGQDRAGFYSYDWLENLFGLRVKNAHRIHPEWQGRVVGDLVRAAPADWLGGMFGTDVGWRITHLDMDNALVLRGWGAFVVRPLDGTRSRLIVRSRISSPDVPVWGAALSFAMFELPHFIMERRMLMGIKERAERWPFEPPCIPPPGTAIADIGE